MTKKRAGELNMKLIGLAVVLIIGVILFAENEKENNLPNVLIIGDSISFGYSEPLKDITKNKVNITLIPENAGHTENGLSKLESWLGNTNWDVIHFNHGLHDLKYIENSKTNPPSHQIQVPLEKYKENMKSIVIRLKKTGARLIFATTTPVPKGSLPLRLPSDVIKYNAVALDVMKEHGVNVNDLYTFTVPQLKTIQNPKNVHFTEEGSKVLAREVARYILAAVEQKRSTL